VSQVQVETPTGSQAKVDTHNTSGTAHADIRALIATTPDATGSVKGKVQLAGDLGGTAASPTVPGLAAKADASAITTALAGKAPVLTQSATKTANYTAADNEIVVADTSGGTFIITGPTSGARFGVRWKAGTVAPTVAAPSGFTIVGAATVTPALAPGSTSGELLVWQAFSTDYQVVSGYKPLAALDTKYITNERTATATLTNKTLTSPTITTPTGIVKGDVGLGSVDNTSDASKNSATATLTNKRITKRIGTTASSATPTADADNHDQYNVTALAANATFGAPTGTPQDGQTLLYRIKDNGTARSLAWNAVFRVVGVTLPTTTVISKTLYVGTVWSALDGTWDAIAVGQQA
jgi:hypothetical protein